MQQTSARPPWTRPKNQEGTELWRHQHREEHQQSRSRACRRLSEGRSANIRELKEFLLSWLSPGGSLRLGKRRRAPRIRRRGWRGSGRYCWTWAWRQSGPVMKKNTNWLEVRLYKEVRHLRIAVHQLQRDIATRSRNLNRCWLDLDRHCWCRRLYVVDSCVELMYESCCWWEWNWWGFYTQNFVKSSSMRRLNETIFVVKRLSLRSQYLISLMFD